MPPLPGVCAGVWAAFMDMRRRQGGSGFGPQPIGFDTLAGWQAARRAQLTPWEVDQVFALDDLWLSAQADTKDTATPPKPTPPPAP